MSNEDVILVTGAAGFIGYHFSKKLLEYGHRVVGVDNLNDYYEVSLKQGRLHELEQNRSFTFVHADISQGAEIDSVFQSWKPSVVVNLAAQAGVRYSLENPSAYIQSNLVGFANILESCRHTGVRHLMYASSSSVYGGNVKVPFGESDPVDHPVSLYAATKRSNELMAGTYSHLYGIPCSGLRFFTVYGEWGRPDMAYFSFARNYLEGKPIRLYNNGQTANDLSRDFTYIGDVVESLVRLTSLPPEGERPHRIVNVGGSNPVTLTKFVSALESALSISAGYPVVFDKRYEGIKPGDVPQTYADNTLLREIIGYAPETVLEDGLQKFSDWFVAYYRRTSKVRCLR